MRKIFDSVNTESLRTCFESLHHELPRGKVQADFNVSDDYSLLAIEETGQFAPNKVPCSLCSMKNRSKGKKEFYHQFLAAVMVHPELKMVLPIGFAAITKRDGENKNDCERNVVKWLLVYLDGSSPQRNFLVVEDALASNGPHVELLCKFGMDFILGVKPDGNQKLSEQVSRNRCDKTLLERQSGVAEDGSCHGYRSSLTNFHSTTRIPI